MVKYKCFKTQCPACGNSGSLQLFINNTGKVTYARVRHHQGKGKYTYCKLDKQQLETLKSKGLQLPSVLDQGQTGQGVRFEPHNPQLRGSSSLISENNHQNKWAGSSARIEHHPPKVGVVGSNPTPPVGSKKIFGARFTTLNTVFSQVTLI